MTKIAIIDMGTNTFHLLVAEVVGRGFRVLDRNHEPVKIGKGGINEGFISESGCTRALQAMCRFRETIDELGVAEVHAFATSARFYPHLLKVFRGVLPLVRFLTAPLRAQSPWKLVDRPY